MPIWILGLKQKMHDDLPIETVEDLIWASTNEDVVKKIIRFSHETGISPMVVLYMINWYWIFKDDIIVFVER